eukprot:g8468.t1
MRLKSADLLVAMHPDQAAEASVDLALRFDIPFFVVPCCVYAKEFPRRKIAMRQVTSYYDLLDYLQAKDPRNAMTMKRAREEAVSPTAALVDDPVAAAIRNTLIVSKLDHLPDSTNTAFLCTHHGGFHCDEALALAMLKILPEFSDMPIVRTRDPAIIEKAKLVVDVGGIYSHEQRRYDHHMGDFTTTYAPEYTTTKLSSAGLVYKHFAKQILESILKKAGGASELAKSGSTQDLEKIVEKIYRGLIEEVDAIDNGVEQGDNLKYRITSGLGSRVKRLNPSWLQENIPAEEENACFQKAMLICLEEFLGQVHGFTMEWYPARKIVQDSCASCCPEFYTSRMQTDSPKSPKATAISSMGRIMILPRCCPWQEHLSDIEKELHVPEEKKILYCIFPDSRSGSFRIQAVPKMKGSFENRKPLPKPWRGVRDAELSKVCGVPGAVFCHASGFIGGNQTLEGAKEMARLAVEFAD